MASKKKYWAALKLTGAAVFFTGVLNSMLSFKVGSAIDPLNYIFLAAGAAIAIAPSAIKRRVNPSSRISATRPRHKASREREQV